MITLAMEREDVVLRFFGERGALLASVNDHPLLGAGTGNTRMWVGGREGPILLDLGGLARAAAQVTGVRLG